jgi:hypothetical protein
MTSSPTCSQTAATSSPRSDGQELDRQLRTPVDERLAAPNGNGLQPQSTQAAQLCKSCGERPRAQGLTVCGRCRESARREDMRRVSVESPLTRRIPNRPGVHPFRLLSAGHHGSVSPRELERWLIASGFATSSGGRLTPMPGRSRRRHLPVLTASASCATR